MLCLFELSCQFQFAGLFCCRKGYGTRECNAVLDIILYIIFRLFSLIFFPSILSTVCWTIPVEAAKKLEVPKSVEMTKEAVRKSVFVESLKHSVISTTNIDRTLRRKMLMPGGYKKWRGRNIFEWGRGDVEKAAMHSTKKGSGDKLTLREGPIKITPIKIFGHQWWFNGKEARGLR